MEKRADRTFHKRVTVAVWCGIVIFACLAFYFFLTKIAILGLLVSIIVVGMVERSIHTTYLFHRVKPIDMEEEMEFLTIDSGRFSGKKHIAIKDIRQVTQMKTAFGIDHYLLLECRNGKLESVQPVNEEGFLKELKRRKHEYT